MESSVQHFLKSTFIRRKKTCSYLQSLHKHHVKTCEQLIFPVIALIFSWCRYIDDACFKQFNPALTCLPILLFD